MEEQQLFISNITGNYTAKNNFEKEICEKVKQWGYVFTNDKDKFFKDLESWVSRKGVKYPRCKPLSVTISSFKGKRYYISIGSILIQIELIPVICTRLYNAESITLKHGFNLDLFKKGA